MACPATERRQPSDTLSENSRCCSVVDDRSYRCRRTSMCRYSVPRKKLGGAFVAGDNSCHASSFETNLGDTRSSSLVKPSKAISAGGAGRPGNRRGAQRPWCGGRKIRLQPPLLPDPLHVDADRLICPHRPAVSGGECVTMLLRHDGNQCVIGRSAVDLQLSGSTDHPLIGQ